MDILPVSYESPIFLRDYMPVGVTLQHDAKYAPKMREIISKYPQVDYVITQTGRNDDGTDPFPANRNEILIGLKDYKLWSDTITKNELVYRMTSDLEREMPGASFNSGQQIGRASCRE